MGSWDKCVNETSKSKRR